MESAAGSSSGGVLGGAMAAAMGANTDPRVGLVGLNVQLASSGGPQQVAPKVLSVSGVGSGGGVPSGLSLALSNVGVPTVPVEKPYGCGDCGKHFKRKDHLNRHRARTFHNSEPPPPIKTMPAPSLAQFQAPTMVQQPPPPQPRLDQQLHRPPTTNSIGLHPPQVQMQPRHQHAQQHAPAQQQQHQFKSVSQMDHSPMNRFPCVEPGCTKSFKSSYHLRRHHVVHTGERRVTGMQSGGSGLDVVGGGAGGGGGGGGGGSSSGGRGGSSGGRGSDTTASGTPKVKFECRICGTKLSRAEHLTRHQRRLHADKETLDNDPKMQNYSCAICGKQCFDSHKLKVHMNNAHLEEQPFECEFCNKKFKAAANLKRHKKIHEKGALAQVAGKAASQQVVAAMRQQHAQQPGTSKGLHAQVGQTVQLGQPGQYFQVQAAGQGGTPIIIQVQNPAQAQQFRPLNQGGGQQGQANAPRQNPQALERAQPGGVGGWPTTAYAWPVQAAGIGASAPAAAAAAADWPWASWSTPASSAPNSTTTSK